MAKLLSKFSKWINTPGTKGIHQNIFAAAALLLEESVSEETCNRVLKAACARLNERHVSNREIEAAVRDAGRMLRNELKIGEGLPSFDATLQAKIVAQTPIDWNALEKGGSTLPKESAFYLSHLFPLESDLVCLASEPWSFATLTRERAIACCEHAQFVTPNPMSKFEGVTLANTRSTHCLDNTGPRRWLPVEFDGHPLEVQAAILKHLAKMLPLVMILFSGNKSLHGWFSVAGLDEETVVKPFFSTAVRLGADQATWPRSHFVRNPGGTNTKTKQPQGVLYWSL